MTGWFRFDINEARARLASRRGAPPSQLSQLSQVADMPRDARLAGKRQAAGSPSFCNDCENVTSHSSDAMPEAGLSRLSQLSRGHSSEDQIGARQVQDGSGPHRAQDLHPGPRGTGVAPAARTLPDPDAFEERAAIMEYDGQLDRAEAERRAAAEQDPDSTNVSRRSER